MIIFRKFFLFCIAASILIFLGGCKSGTPTPSTMEGYWAGTDNNVTEIKFQDNQYVALTTYYTVGSSSQNSLVSSEYKDGVLTWKYCPPAKPCVTMQTVKFNGDTLDVTWTDDNGGSGSMTLKRSEQYLGRGNS